MKVRFIDELSTGQWTRLNNGQRLPYIEGGVSKPFFNGLIAAGATWFPAIPPGYRLATKTDRKGKPPITAQTNFGRRWLNVQLCAQSDRWVKAWEYILPETCPNCGQVFPT